MADNQHFENRHISISQPRIVRIWRNLVCGRKFWLNRQKFHKFVNSRWRTDAILKIIFLATTRLPIVRLRRNLGFWCIIASIERFGDENVKFRKSNMADGRNFEYSYSSIYQPRIVRIWWNLVRRRKYWARRRKRDKNSEIPKFKIADGRHIENRLHIARLRRNLKFGGTIARTQRLDDENVKIRKSNMVDGRHFENHYISTSQPQIVRIARKLVCRQILPQPTETTKKSEIHKFKIADGRRIENHFLAITQLHVVPLRWTLEWGCRITRIRSRSGDQTSNYEHPKQRTSTFWKWIYIRIWATNGTKLTK